MTGTLRPGLVELGWATAGLPATAQVASSRAAEKPETFLIGGIHIETFRRKDFYFRQIVMVKEKPARPEQGGLR